MTKNIFAVFILFIVSTQVLGQERLTFPTYNQAIANTYEQNRAHALKAKAKSIILPFYDDFSVIGITPSTSRWADAFALINTDYAKFPPTLGVATLDAIDEKGKLYSNAGPYPFDADKLTSLPIRLDSIFSPVQKTIRQSDSVYLSFYYQPQGRGLMPAKKDSLLLEFHSPLEFDTIVSAAGTTIEPRWRSVWSTSGGIQVDTFALGRKQYFRQVLIPIKDSATYYKDGFQFRFRNIASLANNYQSDWQSNASQWNIDLVWLNVGRNRNDTTMKDVAFATVAPSMLRNYQAMPYNQYRANFVSEMKDTLSMSISNLDNAPQNISYSYNIRKNSLEPYTSYSGGNYSIFPYLTSGYSTYKPFARPPVNSVFPIGTEEKVVFHIIHTIKTDQNSLYHSNDSTRFTQVFSNYYAYDDGTAEAGIGLNGASGAYAVKFQLNKSDTLRGLQIYFNQTLTETNKKYIDLVVWNDLYGKPNNIIYTLKGVSPVYSENVNEFSSYWFEKTLAIESVNFPSLIFYVGWIQSSNDNLNVGLDRSNDSREKRFYNVDGTWQMSSVANYGSLMLRPVIGLSDPLGITPSAVTSKLFIYPNPATNGILHVTVPEKWGNMIYGKLTLHILTATGSVVLKQSYDPSVNINNLATGFYTVILINEESKQQAFGKLIVK